MTDRYNAIVVVLERDIREDDARSTIEALRHIKGVLSVTPNVANLEAHIAEERAKSELRAQLREILWK